MPQTQGMMHWGLCVGDVELGQALKVGKSSSRWSFDSAMLPQYVHGRPGIVER